MIWTIQLLYFVLMIATFITLLLWAKLPTGICLMASAVVGLIFSVIFSGTEFSIRYLTEGMFGYFDTILVITTAMVFMGAMEACGTLQYISTVLVKALGRFPSLLLIAMMIIIMFPAMVTGSSLASAISAGALVAPIMIKWGIPKQKTGAIIAIGSILGMVAPPVNVPAMVICDVADIPFTGFTVPLLLLSIPLAIVCVLLLGRQYVKPLKKQDVAKVVDVSILKTFNWTVCIPLFVFLLFILAEIIFPKVIGSLGMSAMFVISTAVCFFVGKRYPFVKLRPRKESFFGVPLDSDKQPDCVVEIIRKGIEKSLPAMGLLMGVGIFMEVISNNGVRGWIVTLAISLPSFWKYVGMAISLPLFGGISAFGSASMLGGPFVMALDGIGYSIMVTGGLSLLAAIGEFSPPTAMSANFAASIVGEKKWTKITKSALPALGVIFVYSVLYTLLFSIIVHKAENKEALIWILFAIVMAVALLFLVLWEISVRKLKILNKHAYVIDEETSEQANEESTATEEEATADEPLPQDEESGETGGTDEDKEDR